MNAPFTAKDRDGALLTVGDLVQPIRDADEAPIGDLKAIKRITRSGHLIFEGEAAPAFHPSELVRRRGVRL